MKTYLPKVDEIQRKWLVIDAEGQILGRLAVTVANILRGRNKPTYTPHLDTGDHVIIVNADKVALSGKKEDKKVYLDYSGHMGGQKSQTAKEVRQRKPERLIEDAVYGMMPKGRLARQQITKLHVYAGPSHPHEAQKPEPLAL